MHTYDKITSNSSYHGSPLNRRRYDGQGTQRLARGSILPSTASGLAESLYLDLAGDRLWLVLAGDGWRTRGIALRRRRQENRPSGISLPRRRQADSPNPSTSPLRPAPVILALTAAAALLHSSPASVTRDAR